MAHQQKECCNLQILCFLIRFKVTRLNRVQEAHSFNNLYHTSMKIERKFQNHIYISNPGIQAMESKNQSSYSKTIKYCITLSFALHRMVLWRVVYSKVVCENASGVAIRLRYVRLEVCPLGFYVFLGSPRSFGWWGEWNHKVRQSSGWWKDIERE